MSAYNKVKATRKAQKKLKKFKKSIDILRIAEYNKSIEAKHQIKSHWWLRVKKIKKVVIFLIAIAYNNSVNAKITGQMMWGCVPQNITINVLW